MADQWQYEFLLECSKNNEIAKWNEWRKENRNLEIDLSEVHLSNSSLDRANLNKANLNKVNLYGASLCEASLCEANLSRACLDSAYLREADLSKADIKNASLLNASLFNANLSNTDLRHSNLSNTNLFETNLISADLREANLSNSTIDYSYVQNANLKRAILHDAKLSHANLYKTDLSYANLTGISLFNIAREGWNIEGVKCDYMYKDEYGKVRLPRDRNFEEGEFEKRFTSLPSFEIPCKNKSDLEFVIEIADFYMKKVDASSGLALKSFDVQFETATFTVLKAIYLERVKRDVLEYYEMKDDFLRLQGENKALKEHRRIDIHNNERIDQQLIGDDGRQEINN